MRRWALEFNDVAYWPQNQTGTGVGKDHVTSTLFVCWAVQAALNILYGIPKQAVPKNFPAYTNTTFFTLMPC